MLTEKEFKNELKEVAFQIFISEAEFVKTGEFCNHGSSFIDGIEVIERNEDLPEWYLQVSIQQLRKEAGISYSRLCRRLARCFANDYILEHYKNYRKEYLKKNPQLGIKDFALSDYFSATSNGNCLAKAFVKIEKDIVSVGCDGSARAVEDCEIVGNFIYFNPDIHPDILTEILEENIDDLSIIANSELFDEDETRQAMVSLSIAFDFANRLVPSRKYEKMRDDELAEIAKIMTSSEFLRIFGRTDLLSETATISSVTFHNDTIQLLADPDNENDSSGWDFEFSISDLEEFEKLTFFEESTRFYELVDEFFCDSPRFYNEKAVLKNFVQIAIDAKNGKNVVGLTVDTDLDC